MISFHYLNSPNRGTPLTGYTPWAHPSTVPVAEDALQDLTDEQAKVFSAEFASRTDERIDQLQIAMRSSVADWSPDAEEQRMTELGAFLRDWLPIREPRPSECSIRRYGRLPKGLVPDDLKVPSIPWVLGDDAYSLIIDSGLYIAKCVLNSHPSWHWSMYRSAPSNVDYRQPCLAWRGCRTGYFTPIRYLTNFSLNIVGRESPPSALWRLFRQQVRMNLYLEKKYPLKKSRPKAGRGPENATDVEH